MLIAYDSKAGAGARCRHRESGECHRHLESCWGSGVHLRGKAGPGRRLLSLSVGAI